MKERSISPSSLSVAVSLSLQAFVSLALAISTDMWHQRVRWCHMSAISLKSVRNSWNHLAWSHLALSSIWDWWLRCQLFLDYSQLIQDYSWFHCVTNYSQNYSCTMFAGLNLSSTKLFGKTTVVGEGNNSSGQLLKVGKVGWHHYTQICTTAEILKFNQTAAFKRLLLQVISNCKALFKVHVQYTVKQNSPGAKSEKTSFSRSRLTVLGRFCDCLWQPRDVRNWS